MFGRTRLDLKSSDDIRAMRRAGLVTGSALRASALAARPGMTTQDVDAVAAEPDLVMDVATLTGAAVVALGKRTGGVMGTETGRSAVVEAALSGRPQEVTRRGKPAVVVLSADEYRRLVAAAGLHRESFAEHLLAFPGADIARLDARPRDVQL